MMQRSSYAWWPNDKCWGLFQTIETMQARNKLFIFNVMQFQSFVVYPQNFEIVILNIIILSSYYLYNVHIHILFRKYKVFRIYFGNSSIYKYIVLFLFEMNILNDFLYIFTHKWVPVQVLSFDLSLDFRQKISSIV